MSDDFFDQYKAFDSEDQGQEESKAQETASEENIRTAGTTIPPQPDTEDRPYTATQLAQDPAPVRPQAVQQQAQNPAWQNSYYRPASVQQPAANPNPYLNRSTSTVYGQPAAPQSPASNVNRPYSSANTYVGPDGYYHRSFTEHRTAPAHSEQNPAVKREKKEKASMSKGAIAALLIVCVIISGFAGFGGSMLASKVNGSDSAQTQTTDYDTVSDQLVIHRVSVADSTETTGELVDKGTDEITRAVADSVVEIVTEVVQTSSFYGQYVSQGAGSGVIISEDGYIITNNHVIEGASTITVTLRSGESYEATLIGTDADEDIALLKINATGLTVAVFGDSSTLEVGDKTVIIGNPLGTLGGSVTEGIVSALDRSIVVDGKTMHLMQTDAAINPGNSGGGMFNGQGELVGIVVAKSGGTTSSGSTIDNIGFVIPINNVLNILGDLKQYGYVRGKADTGMSFVDITNQMYAWYYYGSSSTGVYISSVDRGSNAAQAGFSAGDRVISVDGKTVSSASEISSIISSYSAGDTITFEIERSGRTGTIDLTLEEYVP